MGIYTTEEMVFRKPHLFDKDVILDLRAEMLASCCKFNGTSDLDLYNDYVEWIAHILNISAYNITGESYNTYIAIRKSDNKLVGMAQIKFNFNNRDLTTTAHIIECVRPSERRKGYGRLVLQKGIEECRSLGIRKDKLTFERNSKASTGTMNKISNF